MTNARNCCSSWEYRTLRFLLVSLLTMQSVTYCGTKYRKLTLHFNIMFTRDHYYESMFRNISQCATVSVISRRSSELLSIRSIAAAIVLVSSSGHFLDRFHSVLSAVVGFMFSARHCGLGMRTDIPMWNNTYTRLTALFPGLPGWARTRKVKPIWILQKQETVSGSGISWAVCKSAPRSRQITMPAPHHSIFYRPDALPAAQPTASKHWRLSEIISE